MSSVFSNLAIACSGWLAQLELCTFDFLERRPERNIHPAMTPHMMMQPKKGRIMGSIATVNDELIVEE